MEVQQVTPALPATPALAGFWVTASDHDEDDLNNPEPIGKTCSVPAPPALPADKPKAPPTDDPLTRLGIDNSYNTQNYENANTLWLSKANENHNRWVSTVRSESAACTTTNVQQLEAFANQLGPPTWEDIPGGLMGERWDFVEAANRSSRLFATIDAAQVTGIQPIRILIVMANMGNVAPPSNLPSFKGIRIILANFHSFDAASAPVDAWRQALVNRGATDVQILDPVLTQTAIPGVVKGWAGDQA